MGEHARTVLLDVADPPAVDWSAAGLWHVLVTVGAEPVDDLWIPSPGRLERPDAFTRSLLAPGRRVAADRAALRRWRARMGLPVPVAAEPRVSVVVCTHRRSAYLPGLLEALGRLDPAPHEVVVVDNAPGELDSRGVVEAAGARYVREDRQGLDHARTAGVRACTGELVAFTDDDCVPPPHWLGGLGALFADPAVAAVTGPGFAADLGSPAQLRFELSGGFSRGLDRREWDWTRISPLHAGAVGAGANMVFRRAVLEALGDPFPAELDAGTPTESGGDMYALYRTLEAGHRVVYDPATYVRHRHRPDPEAMHRALRGYGVGLSAVMTKLLVEERELGAPQAWSWLWRQYRTALLRRLAGMSGARQQRVAWDYLRGGLAGPAGWMRARRAIAPAPLAAAPAGAGTAPVPVPERAGAAAAPEVSVVIPTAGRPAALARCLAALAAQDEGPPFEVVVADDSRGAGVPGDVADTVVRTGGRGAAVARNAGAAAARGGLLLFLDDDLVPAPGLVARHAARHAAEGAETIVIGHSPPAPDDPGLCEKVASLWWHDHFRLLADASRLTFADMLSGNASMPRALFLRLGGFDESFGRLRREDWSFGHAALEAGARLVYEPGAVAAHAFSLSTGQRLAALRDEGRGDAALSAAHPDLAVALTPPYVAAGAVPRAVLAALAVALPPVSAQAAAGLDALERLRLRGLWRRGYRAAQWASYAAGRRDGDAAAPTDPGPLTAVVADATEPLPAPGACARPFEVVVPGRGSARVEPALGRWNGDVARAAAEAERALAGDPPPPAPEPAPVPPVLLGPAHPPGAEALLAPDAEVVRVTGDPARHWALLGEAVAGAGAERVLIPMPGVGIGAAALRSLAGGLDGDRVAVLLGHDPLGSSDGVPRLRSRALDAERLPALEPRLDYVVLHTRRFAELGGFATDLPGPIAAPLELAERALDAGLVVGHQRTTGLRLPPQERLPWRRPEWACQAARGALLAREGGRTAAVRGLLPLAMAIARRRVAPAAGAATLAAHLAGAADRLPAAHR